MSDIAAKRVKRLAAKVASKDAVVLAFETAGGETFYAVHPDQLNDMISRLLVASLDQKLTKDRKLASPSAGGAQELLTLPIESIAALHAPAKGTVGINLRLRSGFHLAFEMPPKQSLVLSQKLQAAAGKAQAPKSTAKH